MRVGSNHVDHTRRKNLVKVYFSQCYRSEYPSFEIQIDLFGSKMVSSNPQLH